LLYLDALTRDNRKPDEVQPSDKLAQQALDMRLFHLLEYTRQYIPKNLFYESARKADFVDCVISNLGKTMWT
ncbi:Ankyrin repeat-containing protein, partial [Cedratvirus Zaza IHUMI]